MKCWAGTGHGPPMCFGKHRTGREQCRQGKLDRVSGLSLLFLSPVLEAAGMVERAQDVETPVLSVNPGVVTEGLCDSGWDTLLLGVSGFSPVKWGQQYLPLWLMAPFKLLG